MTTGLFEPARRLRSFDDVVSQVRNAIVSGALQPGDRLPSERELCLTFGVSRGTLREALRPLEALGAIEIRAGSAGGIFIAEPSGERLAAGLESLLQFSRASEQELVEFGGSLFAETTYWAAVRADEKDMAGFRALREEAEKLAHDPAGGDRLLRLHASLVTAVAAASKNSVRQALVLAMRPVVTHALPGMRPPLSAAVAGALATDVVAIADAVLARNARAGRVTMRRHIQKLALPAENAVSHRR